HSSLPMLKVPFEATMTILPPPTDPTRVRAEPILRPRPTRSWRQQFRDALRGLKLGIRGHSSFFVLFFFSALVVAAGSVLRCGPLAWCLLLGCIGMVLTAELFHSAIESLLARLPEAVKPGVRSCLDITAAAVLVATLAAALIVSVVFLGRLMELFGLPT